MAIKYNLIEDQDLVRDTRRKISKYAEAYQAVRSLNGTNMAKIDFDSMNLLRGFQSQVNCNFKFRGRFATKSSNLTLYVWARY